MSREERYGGKEKDYLRSKRFKKIWQFKKTPCPQVNTGQARVLGTVCGSSALLKGKGIGGEKVEE